MWTPESTPARLDAARKLVQFWRPESSGWSWLLCGQKDPCLKNATTKNYIFLTCQVSASRFIRAGQPTSLARLRLLPASASTATASSRSKWALPDLNRELQISAAQPRAPKLTMVNTMVAVDILVPAIGSCPFSHPFNFWTFAAGPQPRAPDISGHSRTSTTRARSQWALQDLNCERKMSHRMSEEMSDRMPDRISEYVPDRMPE